MQSTVTPAGPTPRKQPIAGVVPPELAEALIRQVYPSVTDVPAAAALGEKLQRTIVLAPLGWLILAGPYFKKILPYLAKRYTLTNRRLMIQRGWRGTPSQELPLSAIDDVQMDEDSYSRFFRSGTLQVLSNGAVAMTLRGVPEPESFRRAVLSARLAWAPKK
jgi:hypothetical protein